MEGETGALERLAEKIDERQQSEFRRWFWTGGAGETFEQFMDRMDRLGSQMLWAWLFGAGEQSTA